MAVNPAARAGDGGHGRRHRWAHNCGLYGALRPARMPDSTALGRRSMV